jgi:hypothetical protein
MEYLMELTHGGVHEYFRPTPAQYAGHFDEICNTGPACLHGRFVLASTLGASYGIWSRFRAVQNCPREAGGGVSEFRRSTRSSSGISSGTTV